MHILQVTLGFYPAQTWGGPVKVVHQNSRELVRRGHQVTVYCSNLLDKKNKIREGTFEQVIDGIRVVYFDTWHLSWWHGTLGPIWLPDLPRYLRREIGDFDVVHLNGYRSLMMLSVARAAHSAGVSIVTQPHGTMPVIVNSFWAKRLYDRLFGQMELKNISALIALQESECQQAMSYGIHKSQIEIIPNGIDVSDRSQIPERGKFRARFGISPEVPLILFLGRINKKKGTDMLVRAFSRISIPNAHLAIVGPDDGQLIEVESLIQQYHLAGSVTLTGLLKGSDVMSAFRDADIFVLPCRADTFPFAMIEACLANTPMVITDRCEIADMVKNRVAEVVPFDDCAFASAMELLLTDKQRYKKYQEYCNTILEDSFSIKAAVDRLETVYQKVINKR